LDRQDNKKGVTKIDRRKALILLSVVAVAAILGSIVLVYGANGFAGSTSEENEEMMMLKTCGWQPRWQHEWSRGWGRHGFIEVSEEFEENVINIAKTTPTSKTYLLMAITLQE